MAALQAQTVTLSTPALDGVAAQSKRDKCVRPPPCLMLLASMPKCRPCLADIADRRTLLIVRCHESLPHKHVDDLT